MATQSIDISGAARWRHHEMHIATIFGQPYRLTFYRALVVTVNGKEMFAGRDDKPFQFAQEQLPNIKFVDSSGVERDGVWLAEQMKRAVDSEIQKRVDADEAAAAPQQAEA